MSHFLNFQEYQIKIKLGAPALTVSSSFKGRESESVQSMRAWAEVEQKTKRVLTNWNYYKFQFERKLMVKLLRIANRIAKKLLIKLDPSLFKQIQ